MLVKEQSKGVGGPNGGKRIPSHLRTTEDIGRYLDYLQNAKHIHHEGKRLLPLRFYGAEKDSQAFVQAAAGVEALRAAASNRRRGCKSKWLARVYIASTEHRRERPMNTQGDAAPMLSESEMAEFERVFIEEADFVGVAVCWHLDRESGRCDAHFVVLNCSSYDRSHALASWQASIFQRRASADMIEGKINSARKQREEELLRTMPEVRRAKKKDKAIEDLAVQLARKATEAVTNASIAGLIAQCGHQVTRHNERFISVRHLGGKKAFRYDRDWLLQQAETLRQSLSGPAIQHPENAPEPPDQAPSR